MSAKMNGKNPVNKKGIDSCAAVCISRTVWISQQSVTSFIVAAAEIISEQDNGYVVAQYVHTLGSETR